MKNLVRLVEEAAPPGVEDKVVDLEHGVSVRRGLLADVSLHVMSMRWLASEPILAI